MRICAGRLIHILSHSMLSHAVRECVSMCMRIRFGCARACKHVYAYRIHASTGGRARAGRMIALQPHSGMRSLGHASQGAGDS